MIAKVYGELVGATKGEFTPTEGSNSGKLVEYWRVILRDEQGEFQCSFDFKNGEHYFGQEKEKEKLMYKKVELTGNIRTFQGNAKFKAMDIALGTYEQLTMKY